MAALGKVQAPRRAGVEERGNEALPRNEPGPWLGEPCPWLGQAQRKLPGEVHRDCRQPETNRGIVARRRTSGRRESRSRIEKFSTIGTAGRLPRAYSAHLPEKQGEYHPICTDNLPAFLRFNLNRGLFQWF